MQINDLTVEVRDRTLERVGQIVPGYLNLTGKDRWCAVGEWEITLPGNHSMVPHLIEPGSGIVVTGPDGSGYGTLFSGPTTTPLRVRNRANPDGTFTFQGVTDEVVLLGTRAFPDPTTADAQASSQSRSNDTRTGSAEDLMRQYVGGNIVPGIAPAGRLRGLRKYLRLQNVSGGRGIQVTKSPRFQNLLELLQEIVLLDTSLGFRVVQVDDALEFQVLTAGDRRGLVRFDIENGTVTSEEVASAGPTVTNVIVAGQGEGAARTIISRTSRGAGQAEEDWGIVYETFVDQRDTDDLIELQQSGDEKLADARGGTSVKMVPSDDTTMRYGVDWQLGDLVTMVVGGIETTTRVTESALIASPSGVMVGAGIGDLSGFSKSDAQGTKIESIDQRVARLERVGVPVSPPGMIVQFAGVSAPDGWLICDGSAVSRSEYAALFSTLGTTYGTGNGSSTFNLPDLRGRVPVGWDTSQTEFDVLGERGGAKTHTLTAAEMPSHTHRVGAYKSGVEASGYGLAGGGGFGDRAWVSATSAARLSTEATGDGGAHNNLQPYIVLNHIVKT